LLGALHDLAKDPAQRQRTLESFGNAGQRFKQGFGRVEMGTLKCWGNLLAEKDGVVPINLCIWQLVWAITHIEYQYRKWLSTRRPKRQADPITNRGLKPMLGQPLIDKCRKMLPASEKVWLGAAERMLSIGNLIKHK
jgi:hypothetical protein